MQFIVPHLLAISLVSPQPKQWPNCESANSCRPPVAATLKYPHTFLLLRKFSSCTVPLPGRKPCGGTRTAVTCKPCRNILFTTTAGQHQLHGTQPNASRQHKLAAHSKQYCDITEKLRKLAEEDENNPTPPTPTNTYTLTSSGFSAVIRQAMTWPWGLGVGVGL